MLHHAITRYFGSYGKAAESIGIKSEEVYTLKQDWTKEEVKEEVASRVAAAILDKLDQTIDAAFAVQIDVTEEQLKSMHVMSLARSVQATWLGS